ncbi:MAG TPA: hypothetical protein VM925_02195 [Labilithrix sp.]|nr:hypothetical protein [Labilithrix sp.]
MSLARALLAAIALGAVACTSVSLPPTNVLDAKKDETHKPTYNGLSIKSGQLVLTESPDATSYVFFLIPKKFYAFTHVAVISVEDGEPWVYDVTGEVKTFPFKKRMMDNVTGKMFRRRLFDYVAPNLYAEIYDPPAGADGEKIAAFVRQKFKEGVEFDSYFDFHDHKKLFCSELVALAITSAGGPPLGPEPSNPNPSVVAGMKWLGVPPGEAVPAGQWADPARYVASLGQFPSRTSAWAYFEAKRELHRRFTMDQRLGYLVSIDGNGRLDVRPAITSFTIQASHLFDRDPNPPQPGDPRIEQEVRKLADERFGPFGSVGSSAEAPGTSSPGAGATGVSAKEALK